MSQHELSPAPSTTSKGLKKVFSKHSKTSGGNSISSGSTHDLIDYNGLERRDTRASLDSAISKYRSHGEGSEGHTEHRSTKDRLSKFIGVGKKKRRKRHGGPEDDDEEEMSRGRSTSQRDLTEFLGADLRNLNGSQSTLDRGSADENLLTYDSGPEQHLPNSETRPTLSTHNSYTGHLTASSPRITTTHVHPSNFDLHPSQTLPQLRSATDFESSPSPKHADSLRADGGNSTSRRAISPARLKDAFSFKYNKDNSTEPNLASTHSNGNTFRPSSEYLSNGNGSLSTRRAAKGSDNYSPIPKPIETKSEAKGSNTSLPALLTQPATPPNSSSSALQTTVTPPTPTEYRAESLAHANTISNKNPESPGRNSNVIVSPSGNMISHRRIRSASAAHQPSKLSNAISAPLTPTIEEARSPAASRTPSGNLTAGLGGGFFSSVFSAAQNALNLTNNSGTAPTTRSGTQPNAPETEKFEDISKDNTNEKSESTDKNIEDAPKEQPKQPAIETLGMGDLSLSHLGIQENDPQFMSNGIMSSPQSMARDDTTQADGTSLNADNVHAARAVSAAYNEKMFEDNSVTPIAEDFPPGMSIHRPSSIYSGLGSGDGTPPNGSILEGEGGGLRRTGSMRNKFSHKTRNSAASAIAVAIAASSSTLANPTISSNIPRLTGFAVAPKKRNKEFHQLFRSVPEDDYLIEDYSCALQRDIILAGRIYISEGHICFSSNILGWVTTLVISFDEIVSVEKESTAMVFPNAIAIQTLHARHTFRSLLSRDTTYELIIGIWKISHPGLKSSANGVQLDGGATGDKTEKVDSDDDSETSTDVDEEIYDEDEEDGPGSFIDAPEGSVGGSELGVEPPHKVVSRKPSAIGADNPSASALSLPNGDAKTGGAPAAQDFPGPAAHAPTECTDMTTHYDKIIKDDIIPAPLGKIYSLTYGQESGAWFTKWLLEDQKVIDLQMDDDAKKGLSEDIKTRKYSYIKPLNASLGPKQTKCLISETIDAFDLDKSISITSVTQTPDVPSGNAFVVKTRYCFTWAPGNATKLLITFTTEWSGKSWLKGPIEKGAYDGQISFANDLTKALRGAVTTRARGATTSSKKGKSKKKKDDGLGAEDVKAAEEAPAPAVPAPVEDWGLFEIFRPFLSPVVDILRPLVSGNVATIVFMIMFVALLLNWFKGPVPPPQGTGFGLLAGLPATPERIAAYEEMWRTEESILWDWLEDRTKMNGFLYPVNVNGDDLFSRLGKTRGNIVPRQEEGLEARLARESMSQRELMEAIRVTQERLDALKNIVDDRGGAGNTPGESNPLQTPPSSTSCGRCGKGTTVPQPAT
ncbi:MAG: hypothetical protein M1834_004536 [Cirrosporium novae-zelandiae]|nr:MAG: hypothetical protein M1834_004536 [Cirrosporium novae-zelandiae]